MPRVLLLKYWLLPRPLRKREIRNSESRAYGKIDLKRALAVSSNVVYAQLGTELGMESFVDIKAFGRSGYRPGPAIANEGVMMEPVLVKSITNSEGKTTKELKPVKLGNVMEKSVAEKIKIMMQEVVTSGTGHNAAIKGINVAGKTGTAENELSVKKKAKAHSWFVGFAPAEDPKIAVAVIVEYGGSGGDVAASIARRIMSEYLSN